MPRNTFNRFLVVGAVAMVVVKYTIVGVADYTAPGSGNGYDAAFVADYASGIPPENIARLERILAPSPELDYAARGHSGLASLVSYLDAIDGDAVTVPPIYLRDIPDFASLGIEARKARFIAFMLPLVLRANEELEDRRALIDQAIATRDARKLGQWAKLYGFSAGNRTVEELGTELRKRAAPVPVSIALAQAAVESGWGTSRFAIEGNALFGQRTTSRRIGIRALEAENGSVLLRAFKSPFESVHFYMHNLNSNRAYAGFRDLRSRIRVAVPGEQDIAGLVDTLTAYSERGGDYTEDIKNIIRTNNLGQYDGATLAEVS